MDSKGSHLTGRSGAGMNDVNPEDLWSSILHTYLAVHETQWPRLQAEASLLDLEEDLEEIPSALARLESATKVDLFRRRNPHLDLTSIATTDAYTMAVGVLRMFTEE
jgi:hypothetical protein